jgi:hypothetical protein
VRRSCVVAVAGLLSANVAACGGVGASSGRASRASLNAPSADVGTDVTAGPSGERVKSAQSLPSRSGPTRGYLVDADRDSGAVGDRRGYRDSDDGRILAYYGVAASAVESKRVAAVAKHYLALAAAGDGAGACSMMDPVRAKALAVEFGRFGAPYLRGAGTCQQVLSRMFRRRHEELTVPVSVTGVLEKGDRAFALLGSTRLPASFLTLLRKRGAWVIELPFGAGIL